MWQSDKTRMRIKVIKSKEKKNSPRSDEIITADCYDYDYYYVTCRSGSNKSGRAILDRPAR